MAGSRWVTTPMTLRSLTASWTRATELSRATARGRMACGNRMVSRRGRMARSVGTSERLISPPLDSKSGVRSSLSLMFCSSTPHPIPPRVGGGKFPGVTVQIRRVCPDSAARQTRLRGSPWPSALEGGQGAQHGLVLFGRAGFHLLLAIAAEHGEGEGLEA